MAILGQKSEVIRPAKNSARLVTLFHDEVLTNGFLYVRNRGAMQNDTDRDILREGPSPHGAPSVPLFCVSFSCKTA
jgi:hypothetical protein